VKTQTPSETETKIPRASKVRPVPINQMRTPPIGLIQRKFRPAQAEKYAANLDLDKLGLPVVNWRDSVYWIVDGQHRIAALRLYGFSDETTLSCEVYENLSDVEMADLFLGRDDRRRISQFEKFLVACTANRPDEVQVRRCVEAQGLKVSQQKSEGCISAVTSLLRTHERVGDIVLGQVLRVLRDGFAADPVAFDGQIIEAMGHVFNRYNGKTDAAELVKALAQTQYGVNGLLRRAESQRVRTGNQKVQCIAATIVDIHNKRAKRKLPSWWKVTEPKEAAHH